MRDKNMRDKNMRETKTMLVAQMKNVHPQAIFSDVPAAEWRSTYRKLPDYALSFPEP
jgi:hypothetical protein